jgi:acyl carrier protein
MENNTLMELQDVFRKVFENPSLIIERENTAGDISMWDSLTHLELISEIENSFKIKFSLKEAMHFNNIGDIEDCIMQKLLNEK